MNFLGLGKNSVTVQSNCIIRYIDSCILGQYILLRGLGEKLRVSIKPSFSYRLLCKTLIQALKSTVFVDVILSLKICMVYANIFIGKSFTPNCKEPCCVYFTIQNKFFSKNAVHCILSLYRFPMILSILNAVCLSNCPIFDSILKLNSTVICDLWKKPRSGFKISFSFFCLMRIFHSVGKKSKKINELQIYLRRHFDQQPKFLRYYFTGAFYYYLFFSHSICSSFEFLNVSSVINLHPDP